jgi:signal transduction histidine kinase
LVDIDSGQMQQLMVNLLRNASEALDQREGERSVVISTELIELNGQPGMRVKVHDNGPGVRPDKQDLLFEKRFTTKPRGHGIGLITCKRIIDTHEGSISYTYDSGALFSFELPIKNRAANTQEDVAEPAGIEIVS